MPHVTGLQCSDVEWRVSGTAGCQEGADAPELSDARTSLQSTEESRPAKSSQKLQLLQKPAADSVSSSSNKAMAQQTLSCSLTWDKAPITSMYHVFCCCSAATVSMTEDWASWNWLGSSRRRAFRVASVKLQCAMEAVHFAVSASGSKCNWNVQDAAVVTVRS